MADETQKPSPPVKAAVLGAGAWGTALAVSLANRHAGTSAPPVQLWAHESSTVAAINTQHENKEFLPGVALPDTLIATTALTDLADSDIVLMVVPAQFARRVIADVAPLLKPEASLVLCAKGVERDSLKFMSDVASDYLDEAQIAVLSGPSFAADVARGLPTAVTLACADRLTKKGNNTLASIFRIPDVTGFLF